MPDFRKLAILLSLFSVACLASALTNAMTAEPADPPPLRFAKVFTDNMVLQQEKPIRVWGWAGPDARVAVTLTQDRAAFDEAMARVLGEEATKGNQPAVPEDDGSYSLTVQYVEKNPPKLKTQILETKAGADGRWLVPYRGFKVRRHRGSGGGQLSWSAKCRFLDRY